jgi:hypothetical protein
MDDVDFMGIIGPLDSAIVGNEAPTRNATRVEASKPVTRQRRTAFSIPMAAVGRRAAVF